jgi:trk system potassium uptake protein TrkH
LVLFEAMSALNTVGLSAGVAGPDLPWHGKADLIVLMWMGRLEVVGVFVLVGAPAVLALRRLLGSGRAGSPG